MAAHSQILAWGIPWTAKSRTRQPVYAYSVCVAPSQQVMTLPPILARKPLTRSKGTKPEHLLSTTGRGAVPTGARL